MTKITQKITQLPTPPTRTDMANFDTRADTFLPALVTLGTQANIWATQANQVAIEIDQANTAAQAAKVSAQTAATAAESIAGATAWSAGTAYTIGRCVYGSNGHTYRAVSASTGVNPVTDASGKWSRLSASVAAEEIATTASPDKIVRAGSNGYIDPSWFGPGTILDMRLQQMNVVPTLDLDFVRQSYRHYDAAQGGMVEHALTPYMYSYRSSVASFWGPDGQIQVAPRSTPRIDYDPITGKCFGFLNEEESENLLLNSETLSTQTVSVTNQDYTLSFYGSGKIVLSGAHVAALNSAGAYPARTTLAFKPSDGNLSLTVTGQCRYAQLEPKSYATSWIPTGNSAAVRGGETARIIDDNFTSWYNQSGGTFLLQYKFCEKIFSIRTASLIGSDSRITFYAASEDIAAGGFIDAVRDGVYLVSTTEGAIQNIPNSVVTFAVRVRDNDIAYCTNGQDVTSFVGKGVLPNVSEFAFSFAGWPRNLSGHYIRAMYFPIFLPNHVLQELSR